MGPQFLTPILVTGTFTPTPGSVQDVNIVSQAITLAISAVSLPLPTGAATETTLLAAKLDLDKFTFSATRLLVDGSGVIQPVSGTVAVSNFPATQAVTQSTTPWIVDGSGFVQPISGSVSVANFPAVQPVSGTVTTNQGTSPWIVSGTITTSPNVNVHDGSGVSITSTGSSLNVDVTNTVPVTGPLTDTQLRATPVPISGTVTAIPTGTQDVNIVSTIPLPVTGTFFQAIQPISGTVTANAGTNLNTSALLLDTTFTSRINTLGQKTSANSTPVVLASDQSAIPTTVPTVSASAVTRVASAVSSHTLIAANASRKALFFYNDSSGQQYIKVGTTASQTDFTVRMTSQSYYEFPLPIYLGQIDVISQNTNGAIQVTELT